MSVAIEFSSIENMVEDTEVALNKDTKRVFDYNLNDKAAKAKLLKGAKREAFDVVENSSSANLIFNLGSWSQVVLPSICYWNEIKGNKSCKVDEITVQIADVKMGKDVGGKHIDTQVVFFSNRDKVVLHCYNTTQLILVNGHGYAKFISMFLKPYFESKINLNREIIIKFNDSALETLENKKIKRSNVKYTRGPTHLWCTKCDFAAKSRPALAKHKKATHSPSFITKSPSLTPLLAPQYQSTRNNSITEVLLQDNNIVNDQSDDLIDEVEDKIERNMAENIKFTCLECNFKTKDKPDMDVHIETVHGNQESNDVKFVCSKCDHEFVSKDDFDTHIQIHDNNKEDEHVSTNPQIDATPSFENQEALNHGKESLSVVADVIEQIEPSKIIIEETEVVCSICKLSSKNTDTLRMHIENIHMIPDELANANIENEITIQEITTLTKCPHCSIISTATEIESHVSRIHGYFSICGECGKHFVDTKACETHMQMKHAMPQPQEPFPCDECDLVLVDFNNLQDHKNVYHTKEKVILHTCVQCGSTFETQEVLDEHINKHHVSIRLSCDTCPFQASMYTELMKHKVEEHNEGSSSPLDPLEMFLNVLAAQQDIILDHLSKSYKQNDEDLKEIKTKQNCILNEFRSLKDSLEGFKNDIISEVDKKMKNATLTSESNTKSPKLILQEIVSFLLEIL